MTAMNELLERLQRHFDVNNINVLKPGMTTLKIGKDSAEILIRELRDREGYTHLNFILHRGWHLHAGVHAAQL
jgi:hypothetical protein